MRKTLFTMALGTIALGACSGDSGPSAPVNLTLKNDNYPAVNAEFQSGFATGEAAAAIFAPRAGGYSVQHVQFLFGGGGTNKVITLALYADTGGAAPGAPLYSADYDITPSDNAYQDIDLTLDSVSVATGQGLRVAIFLQHDGVPGVAVDSGGISAEKNAIYTASSWSFAETGGITGDWIIRALIRTD